jgi:iron complex outermembrane receptor protein
MIKHPYLRTVAFATVVQFVILFGLRVSAHAQMASPATDTGESQNTGNELQQVTVTGYLLPHVGDGPQPVTTYDQTYFTKTGDQNVADVVQQLPAATGNVNPGFIPGFGFQPGGASIALKGLLPIDTLVLVDGLRCRYTRSSSSPPRAGHSLLLTSTAFRWVQSIVSIF